MSVSPAREVAFRILCRVDSGPSFAVDLLQSQRVANLKEVDRNLATTLVMGVLRLRGELDFQIERLSGKPLKYFEPEVLTILRLGVFQIRFLGRVPKPVVVNEAVEMVKLARKRSASGLVNAVLRKCERLGRQTSARRFEELGAESKESVCRLIPAWLFERWARHFGLEGAKALAWQSSMVPSTILRVRAAGEGREEAQREFADEGVKTRPGNYGRQSLVVESGSVQSAKAVREGRAVIQDEASQLVADLASVRPGQTVLDLCAAPGMKAGQIAASLGEGRLVASDLSARRLRIMARLLSGTFPPGVRLHLVRLDATHQLPFSVKFDRILLDAPCSGTGTLARNPEIKWRLHPKDLPRLRQIQSDMLRNALAVLAPGGRLVYATCSLEPEENEQVVENVLGAVRGLRLLAAAELRQEFPALSPLFDPSGYFRTRPDLDSMDGFFAAVIVRSE